MVGRTTWAHGDNTGSGQPRAFANVITSRDGTTTQTDYTESYRADADPDYVGEPYQAKGANQAQTVASISRGTFDTGTKAFTVNSSGDHWRELRVHGSTNTSGAILVSSFDSQSFEPVYLIPNKSTLDLDIRIGQGLLYRTATYVYTGSGFAPMTSVDYDYDGHGNLTQVWANNGSLTNHVYTNGRLTSTTSPEGIQTQYTYDLIGRIATTTKKGASAIGAWLTSGYIYPAQSDSTITNTYDGANNVTQAVVAGGTLSLTTSSLFDLAGRATSTTAPGGYVTSYGYSSGGRIVTTTLPGSATKIAETYLDGQAKSLTGTAQVAEYYSYRLDSTLSGFKVRDHWLASSGSPAWEADVWDWAGNPAQHWRRGGDNSYYCESKFYNAQGQLSYIWHGDGSANYCYEYDTLGVMVREGLDLNSNGVLDLNGTDRVTEHNYSYFIDGLGRATKQTINRAYATNNSSTPTTTSVHTELLSNLGTNLLSNVTDQDIYGNATYSSVMVDRANRRVITTVTAPDSITSAVAVSYNGLASEARDKTGRTMRTEYDALGRAYKSIDPRTGATTTVYVAGTSQVATLTDPANVVQVTYAYDSAGRVSSVKNALNKYAYTSYTSRGEVYHQWGDTVNPIEYGYDSYGRRTTLSTYRGDTGWTGATWPVSPGTADITTWNYQTATGNVLSKVDATGKTVSFTYTAANQVKTRAWARKLSDNVTLVTATYAYDPLTREQTGVTYNDGTPTVSYHYNRLGQSDSVTDATGTRTFSYNLSGTLELQYEDLPGFYDTRRVGRGYDTTTGTVGRYNRLYITNSAKGYDGYDENIGYDSVGRLNSIFNAFNYEYLPSSNLVKKLSQTAWGWNYSDNREYDASRDWLTRRNFVIAGTTQADFNLTQDILGRTTNINKTGAVFNCYGNTTQGLDTSNVYNDRSEVTSDVTKLGGTSTVLTGRNDAYAFDPIGNRTSVTQNGITSTYSPNALNQYDSRTVPGVFDVAGSAASGATITVNGSSTGVVRHGPYFFDPFNLSNNPTAVYAALTVSDGTTSSQLLAFLAPAAESFAHDADGNLTSDGRWDYTYDAENRLVSMQTHAALSPSVIPNANAQRLEFKYDYLGRRVEKIVKGGYNGTSYVTVTTDLHFLYDGWNLIHELDALNSLAKVRAHVWGLDLSGSLQGAGGVGGLLYTRDMATGAAYIPVYDGNGNILAMCSTGGTLAAITECDAFGKIIRSSGTWTNCVFGFSTKYTDVETDLVYYGHRYYSPSLGRFINKDPIEEQGGLNLYAFCLNNAINGWDYLGNDVISTSLGNGLWLFTNTDPTLNASGSGHVGVVPSDIGRGGAQMPGSGGTPPVVYIDKPQDSVSLGSIWGSWGSASGDGLLTPFMAKNK